MTTAAAWQHEISRRGFVQYLTDQRITDRQIAIVLRDASKEAEKMILSIPGESFSAIVRRAQYAQSAKALREMQAKLWGHVTTATRQGLERTIENAARTNLALSDYLIQSVGHDSLTEGMRLAAEHAVENVKSKMINNISLSKRVYKNEAWVNGKVDKAVLNGIATNKTSKEIAASVRDFIRPDVPGGESFAASRLSRTEINNAFHTTTILAGNAQPWVEGQQWNLSGGHDHEDDCDDFAEADTDGLGNGVFAPGNVPDKPHPQCECYLTIVTTNIEDFTTAFNEGEYDGWLESEGFAPVGD